MLFIESNIRLIKNFNYLLLYKKWIQNWILNINKILDK
jgi:hypothetical protein